MANDVHFTQLIPNSLQINYYFSVLLMEKMQF